MVAQYVEVPQFQALAHGNMVVSKTIVTETAHRLVDYDGKCSSIHGHSWHWTVHVHCKSLLPNGIAVDFGKLKQVMNECIHDVFDHALVLSNQDPLLIHASDLGISLGVLLAPDSVQEARVVVLDKNPTSENLALYAKDMVGTMLIHRYPALIDAVYCDVGETATCHVEV